MASNGFGRVFTEFYLVLPSFSVGSGSPSMAGAAPTDFYRILWLQLAITEFYRILLGFTYFYRVLWLPMALVGFLPSFT